MSSAKNIGNISIEKYMPNKLVLKPTICISDLHLLPEEKSYGIDIPEFLLDFLNTFSSHQIFILGDFIESLVLSKPQIKNLVNCRRLLGVFENLKSRDGLRIVTGNHDSNTLWFMKEYFGHKRIKPGGFRIGRIAFVHGHEPGLDISWVVNFVPHAIALGGALSKVGINSDTATPPNKLIASHYNLLGLFPIFGHTHQPEIKLNYANSGCFINGKISYLTINDYTLSLWEI